MTIIQPEMYEEYVVPVKLSKICAERFNLRYQRFP